MRILITGSNGLLGQYLVKIFQEKKLDFVATSKGKNRNTKLKNANYKSLDICNKKALQDVFEKYQPNTIINTAALTHVDICEKEKEKCWQINVAAVQNLLEICEKKNTHVIHLSTDFVFDGQKENFYKENDVTNPLNYYGKSKEAAENILLKSSFKNWSFVRTILVYGFLPNMSRSNLVLWVKEHLEKRQKISVVADQFRNPTYAKDLAKGCCSIAQKKATGIFHLCGKENMSILKMAKSVANFFELPENLIHPTSSEKLNQPAKRPPHTSFDLKNAKKKLNYAPISFEESLQEIKNTIQYKKINE